MKPQTLVGSQLGRYRLQACLGAGGAAAVYQAVDTLTGRPLAIKVLFPPVGCGPELTERFRREARMAARLDHPGILAALDVGEADGWLYIAMNLVEGQSLQQLLETRQRLDEATAADIAAQVAEALDYAHARGVIHRDVKPSNILIDHQGRAVLTDFGIALGTDDPALTATGLTVGTPAYMSPEQAAGQAPLDGRVDLYALGVVLYQMVAGQTPFRGTTPQVMHAHVYQPPPLPSTVATVSPELESIILRCLAKRPGDRYPTAAALAADLRTMVGATRTDQHAVSQAGVRGMFRWASASSWTRVGIGVLVTVALAGTLLWTARSVFIFQQAAPAPGPTSGAPTATASPALPLALATLALPTGSEPALAPGAAATATASPSWMPSSTPTPLPATPSPTAARPSATPTAPRATPTRPPATSCPQPVAPALAGWLAATPQPNLDLGCPRSPGVQTAGAWEPFERGQMLWRKDVLRVMVLEDNGRWAVYEDNWHEGDAAWDASLNAPAELFQPVRGFGLVWREQPGVRDALGWATQPEVSFDASVQSFERALLIADPGSGRLWALFSDGVWETLQQP